MAGILLLAVSGLNANFVYNEDFMGTSAEGWVFGSESGGFTPELTADSGLDTPGSGWLRLSTNGPNQANYAYLDNTFTSVNNAVSVTFDFTIHGGIGADGISFFIRRRHPGLARV